MQRLPKISRLFLGVRKALRFAPVSYAAVAFGGVMVGTVAATTPYPAELELSALEPANGGNGEQGAVFVRPTPDVTVGAARAVGDVNGDGLADFSILDDSGYASVVFGAASGFPASFDISTLLAANGGDGVAGFVTREVAVPAGDINGDGLADLVIGGSVLDVPNGMPGARIVYVLFGSDEQHEAIVDGADLLPVNGGDGSAGFTIFSQDAGGFTAFGGADINGDGIDDLALGFPGASLPGRTSVGRAYVLFGRDGDFAPTIELASLLTVNGGNGGDGFVLNGERGTEGPPLRFYGDYAGGSLAGDDFNGDGVDDLLVGAEGASRNYVVFGHEAPFAAEMELAALVPENGGDGSAGAIVTGVNGSLGTNGHRVHFAGDVNGDGIGDLAVGQPFFNEGGAGRLYIAFGSEPLPALLNMQDLLPANGGDGTEGFILQAPEFSYAGAAAIGSGDVNGDGLDDLLVGRAGADPGGRANAGSAYLVYGCRNACAAQLDLESLRVGNGDDGFVLNGWQPGDFAGSSVAISRDVNSDGVGDLIVSAVGADGAPGTGKAYLVYGQGVDTDDDGVADVTDNCRLASNDDQRDTDLDGFGNVCDADLNNDGVINFIDLALLKSVFFCLVQNGDALCANADFNGEGNVNFEDLAVMKAGFFGPPGPGAGANNAPDTN